VDIRKIKKLIELLEESALTEIEITEGEESIRLSRAAPMHPPVTQTYIAPPVTGVSMAPTERRAEVEAGTPPFAPARDTVDDENTVGSPMVGTYYDSPSPDSGVYVTVGTEVAVGDTLCIIEAMKIFNHVEAERAGTVRKIFKQNGDPVEYGEPLFVIS
jgi:acetyl-CoA carboxylase biotin carboxyl carrier protein